MSDFDERMVCGVRVTERRVGVGPRSMVNDLVDTVEGLVSRMRELEERVAALTFSQAERRMQQDAESRERVAVMEASHQALDSARLRQVRELEKGIARAKESTRKARLDLVTERERADMWENRARLAMGAQKRMQEQAGVSAAKTRLNDITSGAYGDGSWPDESD